MKRIVALLLALVLAFALVACGPKDPGTQSQNPGTSNAPSVTKPEFEWDVSFSYGEHSARCTVEYLEKISADSGGRIKFHYYYSNSLIQIAEIPKALKDNTVQISALPGAMFPNQLVYTAFVLSTPFLAYGGPHEATSAWWDMYRAFPEVEKELADLGIVNWVTYTTKPYHMFFNSDVNITTPSDLAGHKIIATKPVIADLITENNGAPIGASPASYYENLEKAVCDGVLTGLGHTKSFGIQELIKTSVEFGVDGTHYDTSGVAISKKAWDELPADIQALFTATGEELSHVEAQRSIDDTAEAEAIAEANWKRIILTDDQIQVWKDAVQPLIEKEMNEIQKQGKDKVWDMYNWLLDWVAKNGAGK